MKLRILGTFATAAVLLIGCRRSHEPRIDSHSEVKTTDPGGRHTTTSTESTQIGSTLDGKTEVKTDTGHGTVTADTETVVGTITAFDPGKHVEVLTGDGKKHGFDLQGKDTSSDVEPGVTVGTKVRLVRKKDGSGRVSVRVDRAGAA